MAHVITTSTKPDFKDAAGDAVLKSIRQDLGIGGVDSVRTARTYKLDGDLELGELRELGRELFSDPVLNDFVVDDLPGHSGWMIEVGLKPGVKDNEGEVASGAVQMWLGREMPVYTSKVFLLEGELDRPAAERIATRLLSNVVVENYQISGPRKSYWYMPSPKVSIDMNPPSDI